MDTTGEILTLTTDGKGIVVRPSDLRPETRRAAGRISHKLKRRPSTGERLCRKHLSQVASVYTVEPFVRRSEDFIAELRDRDALDRKRFRPENERVWASVEKDADEVIEDLFEEAQRRTSNTKDVGLRWWTPI